MKSHICLHAIIRRFWLRTVENQELLDGWIIPSVPSSSFSTEISRKMRTLIMSVSSDHAPEFSSSLSPASSGSTIVISWDEVARLSSEDTNRRHRTRPLPFTLLSGTETFSITPSAINSRRRVMKNRLSVLVGFLKPYVECGCDERYWIRYQSSLSTVWCYDIHAGYSLHASEASLRENAAATCSIDGENRLARNSIVEGFHRLTQCLDLEEPTEPHVPVPRLGFVAKEGYARKNAYAHRNSGCSRHV